jgi:SH3 domain-binding protein 5 (SH3BP5)
LLGCRCISHSVLIFLGCFIRWVTVVAGIHDAAKETIALAEQRFLSNSKEWEFDNAWQEMLNHATIKVMAAEKQKTESESEHLKRAATFTAAEQENFHDILTVLLQLNQLVEICFM